MPVLGSVYLGNGQPHATREAREGGRLREVPCRKDVPAWRLRGSRGDSAATPPAAVLASFWLGNLTGALLCLRRLNELHAGVPEAPAQFSVVVSGQSKTCHPKQVSPALVHLSRLRNHACLSAGHDESCLGKPLQPTASKEMAWHTDGDSRNGGSLRSHVRA